jgi:hypothetical protein
MRFLPRLLVALAALFALSAPLSAQDGGGAVLTVTGDIANINRGRFDQFHDGFLNYHGKTFEKAFEFDRAAIAALPQQSITANAEPWSAAVKMSGPKLADVLGAAGATGKPITVYAMDGYGAAMTIDQIAARDWVLAMSADGKPLGIGGRGPLWLAYDTGDGKATAEEEGAWVWSVFHIEVGE